MRLPISPTGRAEAADAEAGFTLLEVVCVVAILALISAMVLPAFPRGTSRSKLESYAVALASLLKADRNAAVRRQVEVATEVDAAARTIRSGASRRVVIVPKDVDVDAILTARCGRAPSGSTIRFFASGMSCGGVVAMTRAGSGYEVRVNWLTGGVEVVPFKRT